MATYPARTRRWTRVEYERLIDIGVFRADEPLELLGGELVESEPQNSAHYTAIELDDESEPEPDVAVTRGTRRSYSRQHPSRPALVVEVAESRLAFDREHKGSLYARARLDDYWIVNLVDRVLEVYRRPVPDPSSPFGWRYASKEVLSAESFVELLVAPGARILVSDLLP